MGRVTVGTTGYEKGRPETFQKHHSGRGKYIKLERITCTGELAVCEGIA